MKTLSAVRGLFSAVISDAKTICPVQVKPQVVEYIKNVLSREDKKDKKEEQS